MKKSLNIEGITNELKGNSAFFPRTTEAARMVPQPSEPEPARPLPSSIRGAQQQAVVASERTADRSSERRATMRHSFEFFQDQLEHLKQLSLQDQMQGKSGNMSEMVRDALDEWMRKRREP